MVKSRDNSGPSRPGSARETARQTARQTDRQLALLAAAITIGLLVRGVARDLLPGDAGEFQFAAWRWGLAHPTGYPLYLLLGGLWQRLWALFGLSPAAALNAASAVLAGLGVALLYLRLVTWLPGALWIRRLAALVGAAMLAANPTLRSQSLQAEVYTLHLCFVLALLWAADHAGDRRGRLRLALLFGLALTHHATTVLLAPPLALYLWLRRREPGQGAWLWRDGLGMAAVVALPLLLYLYIPLRSGPGASPWYHQRLGEGVLSLYEQGWPAFLAFVSGRAIAAGFHGVDQALAQVPMALLLWLRHFEWPGLLLTGLGLFVLVRTRRWPMLALTVSLVGLHQLFNLFYAIGDIFVYYIPLYLMACVWVGYGAAGIGSAFRFDVAEEAPTPVWSVVLLLTLFWAPLQLWQRYNPMLEGVEQESQRARSSWEQILAAAPPSDAILVSNDRNEIVPLFYLQAVEGRALGHTGLFPGIAPTVAFGDVGATVQTALDRGGGQPVYLIKPMPGLETRFALVPRQGPLVEVLGPAVTVPPAVAVAQPYGPLQLVGYSVTPMADGVELVLQWEVREPLAGDYTTTVQLFGAAGDKLGQDDRRPGGDFYPTTLWKPGERLLDRHTVALPPGSRPVRLLVGMYAGPDAALLAPALELPFGP